MQDLVGHQVVVAEDGAEDDGVADELDDVVQDPVDWGRQ
jgi:hypothetical protein